MRTHRFFLDIPLSDSLVIADHDLLHQWKNVLRIPQGGALRLFNGKRVEREYTVTEYLDKGAALEISEEIIPALPTREITVCWSLLKKDKNEWVVQKCTEIGARRLIPMISERTEKTGYVLERMNKIAIEAAEQCGRGDIPELVEPLSVEQTLEEFGPAMELYVCDHEGQRSVSRTEHPAGFLVGPEGGWSDKETLMFSERGIPAVSLGAFTYRAETAVIAATLFFGAP